MIKNRQVDEYIARLEQWRDEFVRLRTILLECGLSESIKWEQPCYAFENNNIVLVHGFKEYCALLFFKGALLKDNEGILIQQTENVQAGRQIRFTNLEQINRMVNIIQNYVIEAIAIEKSGLLIEYKKTEDYPFPDEFIAKLEEVSGLQDAFESLTPGRQRGYLLYFSAPKLSKTRVARIEKYTDHIMNGKGLNDR